MRPVPYYLCKRVGLAQVLAPLSSYQVQSPKLGAEFSVRITMFSGLICEYVSRSKFVEKYQLLKTAMRGQCMDTVQIHPQHAVKEKALVITC